MLEPPVETCGNGHARTEENTYSTREGKRECYSCKRERDIRRYQAKRLELCEKQREHYRKHSRELREKKRAYRQENLEDRRAYGRHHYVENKELYRERNRKKRAALKGQDNNFSPWMLRYYRYSQQNSCFYCGDRINSALPANHPLKENLEHMTPLIRGGAHDWSNTVLSCASCNARKATKTAEEFRS